MVFVVLGLVDWGNKEMKKKMVDIYIEELVFQVFVVEQFQVLVIKEKEFVLGFSVYIVEFVLQEGFVICMELSIGVFDMVIFMLVIFSIVYLERRKLLQIVSGNKFNLGNRIINCIFIF